MRGGLSGQVDDDGGGGGEGVGSRGVVCTMHRCVGAVWGVGVAGGRRARLIRRWRGRRASLTPRSAADRALVL